MLKQESTGPLTGGSSAISFTGAWCLGVGNSTSPFLSSSYKEWRCISFNKWDKGSFITVLKSLKFLGLDHWLIVTITSRVGVFKKNSIKQYHDYSIIDTSLSALGNCS